MARPAKQGLDYFPLDTGFDDPVELIEAEHGLEGLAILILIWQKIYQNGYYILWDEDTKLLFARRHNVDKEKVSSVLNSCIFRKLFDKELFEKHNILTSAGIQKRYLTACAAAKRKTIVFEERFLLVGAKFSSIITELIRELIPEETEFTPEETRIIPEVSTQRKGKESKGKERERKGNNSEINSGINETPTFLPIFYQQVIGQPIPISFFQTCQSYIDDGMDEVVISQAILKGRDKSVPHIYISTVLDSWFHEKKFTLEDIKEKPVVKEIQKSKTDKAKEAFDEMLKEVEEEEKRYG